jgi:hypothetical protein
MWGKMMDAAHEIQSINEDALRGYMRKKMNSRAELQYPFALDAQLLDVFFASTYYAQLKQDFFGAIEREYARLEVDRESLIAAPVINDKDLATLTGKQDALRTLYDELVIKLQEDLLHAVITSAFAYSCKPKATSRHQSWPIAELTDPSRALITYLHFGTDKFTKNSNHPGFVQHAQAAIQPHLDALNKRRDPWRAFFKGLLGVIIAIGVTVPTGGLGLIPLLMSKSYRHAFFAAKTKHNVDVLGDQLAEKDINETAFVSNSLTQGITPEHMATADLVAMAKLHTKDILVHKEMYDQLIKSDPRTAERYLKQTYRYSYKPFAEYYNELVKRSDFTDIALRGNIINCQNWIQEKQADIERLTAQQPSALSPAPK